MNARARMIAGGWVVVPVVLSALSSPAAAQHPIPESQRWATITHAGNAAYVDPKYQPNGVGRVDYEYQISRTEVTGTEYFEFFQAYLPYATDSEIGTDTVRSTHIRRLGYREFELNPWAINRPVEFGWRYAARYCNWLHNGKANTREAFETGAYDVSTFTNNSDGSNNDQPTRSPGARYWIPSLDEWTKATYYDPNRYGPDQPGYWQYAHGSDQPPILGLPQDGGQTGAQTGNRSPEVAGYRNVQTPWGLWDTSGGVTEWLENKTMSGIERMVKGSSRSRPYDDGQEILDRVYFAGSTGVDIPRGLRLARQVPGPGSVVFIGIIGTLCFRTRRRSDS